MIKKVNVIMILAAMVALGAVSCKKKGCTDPTALNYSESAEKEDNSCEYDEEEMSSDYTSIQKSGAITANETWTADNVYVLNQKVVVNNGVTLTIEAGTIVKGAEGSGSLASALVVAQGGKINAVGTSSQPIIFTSVLDNIAPGQLSGTNLVETDQGLWGGLIVLGNAPISAGDGDVISQIEGIPSGDTFGAFGGNDPADNSGTISYVSIRHGGALIGSGNEINGLTLGGVGNGTTISNIEIVSNLDDGIEFFGGTVNVSNLLIGFQGDDGVDIDMNYSGTVSNFMVVNGSSSDEGLEIDGPEGTTHTSGLFTLENGTVYGSNGIIANGDFKSKAQGNIQNVKIGNVKVRASYSNACTTAKEDAFTHLTDVNPTLIFTSCEHTGASVYTGSDDGAGTTCTVSSIDQNSAQSILSSSTASGANNSVFSGWTWMSIQNKF